MRGWIPREAMAFMKTICALLFSGMLLAPVLGWSADTDAELRALRQQVAAMRKQLAAARNELAAAGTVGQSAQSQLNTMRQQVELLRRQVESLRADVSGLRSNSVFDLNGYLTFDISNGYPTALFRGVNVQVVNGLGETQTVNGTGNLIVGYNRPAAGDYVCSVGPADSANTCQANGGVWAKSHKSGSHNIVGGDFNNYASFGGVVMGMENSLSGPYATVTGGSRNRSEAPFASVSGGSQNSASGMFSTVGAGFDNHALGNFSSVSGGAQRSAASTNNWAAGPLVHPH
jgi:hypothetical protein